MDTNKKIVVAHPDKQHSFKTAVAVSEMCALDKYITTVYDKPGSLTHFIAKFTKGDFKKKLQAHRTAEIPDNKVKQFSELLSLLLLILVRIDKNRRFYSKVKAFRDKAFNKKVAKYCKKNEIDAIISYDVVSAQLYDALGDYKIIKVLDMSAPHFDYMCKIFENEVEKHSDSSLNTLLVSPMFRYWREQSKKEIVCADAFLVASDFTKKSLIESGADGDKIFKCVYGLNHTFFNTDDRKENQSNLLRCVYVGSVTEQKGCRYLFEAIKQIKSNNDLQVEFTVVGGYDPSNPLIKSVESYCNFVGYVLPNELKSILLQSDVFIFPSLADGFGFSVLEAMACGVVPICSKNAGVSDLIEDGLSGFVIDATDSDNICSKIVDLVSDNTFILDLRSKAQRKAQNCTWENYNLQMNGIINNFFEKG